MNQQTNLIMNRLTMKALMLSIITEIKHGYSLPNAAGAKARYKKMVGAPKNTTNMNLLTYFIKFTYEDNDLIEEYNRTMKKFKMA